MMISRLFRSAACVLALSSFSVAAEETTWEVTGTFDVVEDAAPIDLPSDFIFGTEYRMVIRFDNQVAPGLTRAVVCDVTECRLPTAQETPTGFRYDISQPGMQIDVYAGAECQPCTFTSPAGGNLIVRDNYPVRLGINQKPTDGISLGLVDPDDEIDIGVIFRTENLALNLVTGPQVPYLAPAAAPDLESSLIQFQDTSYSQYYVRGETRSVDNPSYGVGYIFTARDCRIPARTDIPLSETRPYDCANVGANRANAWAVPAGFNSGGGLGLDGLSRTFAPSTSDIDASWGDGGTNHAVAAANLGLTPVPMGSLFGDVTFTGPAAFPVLKGLTRAGDSARINTNLFAYQRYNYSGGVTALPLVLALTYQISENSNDPDVSPFLGDRPGGAGLGATMSIVDGGAAVRLEAIRQAGNIAIRGISCGNEAALGLPAGSVLGTATIDSAPGEQGPYAVTRSIESCQNPGQPITLAANQSFIVVTGMQLPSRGQAPQPPRVIAAPANGWVDSANTLRVTFDPEAPRELVQALADAIEPACTDCDLAPEPQAVSIDIKPGSTNNCINPGSNGVIPVGILGSKDFLVADVRIDDSLALGALTLRVRGKSPACSVTSVNSDAHPDLVCHFENAANGWQTGQGTASVSGKLVNGIPFVGSDKICLVQ